MLLLTTSLGQSQSGMIINPSGPANMMLTQSFVTLNYKFAIRPFCGAEIGEHRYDDEHIGTVLTTAAHCLVNAKPENLVARYGAQELDVERIELMPCYDAGVNEETRAGWKCDAAAVYLDGFILNDVLTNTAPLQVHADEWLTNVYEENFNQGTVIGMGLDETGTQPTNIMQAHLTVLTNEKCQELLPNFGIGNNGVGEPYNVLDTQICTSNARILPDSQRLQILGLITTVCNGDSGGPLLVAYTTRQGIVEYAMIGIVSWRHGCGQGTPDVYTRVAHPDIREFFLKHMPNLRVAYQ